MGVGSGGSEWNRGSRTDNKTQLQEGREEEGDINNPSPNEDIVYLGGLKHTPDCVNLN